MNILDTPLLLDLLLNRLALRRWLPRAKSEGREFAITDVNLVELYGEAARLPPRSRLVRRIELLSGLAEFLPVLSVSPASMKITAEVLPGKGVGDSVSKGLTTIAHPPRTSVFRDPYLGPALIAGVAVANGAREIWTTRSRSFPRITGPTKVLRLY
jgi:hypothetical protein